METRFFLHETGIKDGLPVIELFFQLLKKPLGDPTAPMTDITVKAEKDHVARYHSSYKKFKKENPDFVLQWPELDYVVPVVEEVIEEVAKELPAVEEVSPIVEEAKPL